MENQRTTALLELDISVAFDTLDFNTLFDRLRLDFGHGGAALDWLRSSLIGRTQHVGVSTSRSSPVKCLSGFAQGTVAVRDIHLSSQQRRCSTSHSSAPVCRRQAALRHLAPVRRFTF